MTSESRRILLILGTSTGGIGQHVRSLAFGLVSRGHRVVVAAPTQADDVFDFASTGARFVEAAISVTPSPKDLLVARQVARWVSGADVVHAHGFRAGLVALSAGAGAGWPLAGVRRASVPLVVTWHNQVLDGGVRGQVMHRVEQSVARGATLNLGASSDLVDRARALGGRAELGAVAAPTPSVVKTDRDEVRQAIGVGDEPMVLAVGRLHGQKDYPTLLAAMAQLQSRRPQPVLVIAGDGPEADSIAELSGALAVRSLMLGRRGDVVDLMNAADVLALSSLWEARALAVQEAVLAGLPIVATSVGGIPELIGTEALLVPPRDPNALAAALGEVLDQPEDARDRAERARALAATWPDENGAIERVLEAYDTVCELQ